MKLKKCLSAVTAAAIAISAIAVTQFVFADAEVNTAAAEAYWGSDYGMAETDASEFTYYYDDRLEGIVVTDYNGIAKKVRVPEVIDGSPVLELDFSNCKYNFKALMIPDTVEEVSLATYSSLLEYYNLMPAASVNDLEYYYDAEIKGVVVTGYKKDSLELKIPEKVKLADPNDSSKINEYKVKKIDLSECDKTLKALVLPDADEVVIPNHEDVAIRISDLKSTITRSSKGKKVDGYPYTNIGVEKTNIPAQLEEIGTGDFTGCMIREVYIPDNHSEIGKWAFGECFMLSTVVISNENTKIDDGAFRDCYALKNIELSNIDAMGDWAFSGCANLDKVNLSEELAAIGKGAFSRCQALSTIRIPASVRVIGDYAFNGCDNLLAINVAEENGSFVSIDGVLFNSAQTKVLKFPEGKSANEYTIPDTVSEITRGAFRACSVTTIIMPDSVKKIGDGAFENCEDLRTLDLPSSVSVIQPGAFNGCNFLKLHYKSNTYKNKNSGAEYDMSRTFEELYVDINTSIF
ncbi:MAG: leucine-rich repeat domain-containing protein [Oscillospiraceae bacterium]